MAYPRFVLSRTLQKRRRTSGDITLNSTSWANVDTGLDMTIEAQVGDEIEYGVSLRLANAAVEVYFDVATIVSAAVVNTFSTRGAESATSQGVSAWWVGSGGEESRGGTAPPYTIVSGDLAADGKVTLRLRYRQSAATNRTLAAVAILPLDVWVRNSGPADPY